MKLMVIDGNSIVNRAFYGIRLLSTKEGLYTNAVYGFLSILQKLLKDEEPEALCVTFDRREPTFRHLEYEGYKAQRKGMPEELAMQMPLLKEVLDAMNIPRYELAGWEADDLIGTIARRCEEAGWDCVAVTGDKDSLQLLTDRTHVKLVSSRMGRTETREMTPAVFEEEYGFGPARMVDLKALMGDASDNIPGVPGVGEKTAMDLLHRFGSVAELYEQLPELPGVKPGVLKKLEEGRDSAFQSFRLATICRDAPVEFTPEDALRRAVDKPRLYQCFLKLEFSKLIESYGLSPEDLAEAPAEEAGLPACAPELVTDRTRMEELLALWRQENWVSVLALPGLRAVAVCWGQEGAVFLPDQLDCYDDFLWALFSRSIRKGSHDNKELMAELLAEGLSTEGFIFDSALAAYLLAPTDGSYELPKLAMTYFHTELPKAELYQAPEAFGPLSDREAPMAALVAHTALIRALGDKLLPELEAMGMGALYREVELPLCPVLAEMERTGFLVDREALRNFGEMLKERIAQAEQTIYTMAGGEFNINSTKQLGVLLFETLELPPLKKTKTGYSTNAEVLEQLRDRHPIIEEILTYRKYTKLQSTYVEGLGKVIGPDGRIHTKFQNTVTATGRLSSAEPNLQNIPTRTELGSEIRKMFVPAPGKVLVDADYSQIELRLLAHIADDPEMIRAYQTGEDIHRITASQVFGVPVEEVTPVMRSSAKAVNFGIVYGISEFSLAQDIHVARWEAKEYMDRYFSKYAGIRAYMKEIVEQAKGDGYVSTLMGRRRWLPELKSSNFNMRSFGERVALNMPIQGTAADIMKLAMVRVHGRLQQEGLEAKLVLQVHDELIVEAPEGEAEQVKAILTEEMERVLQLSVPLEAEAHTGHSWYEAK